jgi:sulfur-oxidizing protein SoxB
MTLSRREFVQVAAAASVLVGPGNLGRAAAQQRLTQAELLRFDSLGQVTLLHFTDIHAQLLPLYFREPSINVGTGPDAGLPPHLTGRHLLDRYRLMPGSAEAYAFSSDDFLQLARQYGRVGGIDRMATLIKAIRAERPGRTLLLDGGDTWQGSYTSLKHQGGDMVNMMNALGVEAMSAHWEFTYGAERVKDLKSRLRFPFLCGNVKDGTWGDDVFQALATFERGGISIAVIGQAYPYTPIANPRWMIPDWSFGIEEVRLQTRVDKARSDGAELVVLLSHNGFDIDRKLAARVRGIDVILSGHTHDAIPMPEVVEGTLLVASGSHGKFLARLDLEVKNKKVADWRFRLIPVLSESIRSDPEIIQLVDSIRHPHLKELDQVLGKTESMLYRRGTLGGSFDDLICQVLLAERNAEIALTPGFRWGATLLPGETIRLEDVYNQTAITYPAVYRTVMTGAQIKDVLEDVADNLFNPDPYLRLGGDMVRVGGMSFAVDPIQPAGRRIAEMTLERTGQVMAAERSYVVTGWASVDPGIEGPPIYDLVARHIERERIVKPADRTPVRLIGADARGVAR